MASSLRTAAKQIDWTKLSNTLPSETVAALQAFRKRNDEAKRLLNELKEQSTTVDFSHYRKVLKNQAIVDQAEKAVQGFKPVAYNLDAQLKAIDQFEAKAVRVVSCPWTTCHSYHYYRSRRLPALFKRLMSNSRLSKLLLVTLKARVLLSNLL